MTYKFNLEGVLLLIIDKRNSEIIEIASGCAIKSSFNYLIITRAYYLKVLQYL